MIHALLTSELPWHCNDAVAFFHYLKPLYFTKSFLPPLATSIMAKFEQFLWFASEWTKEMFGLMILFTLYNFLLRFLTVVYYYYYYLFFFFKDLVRNLIIIRFYWHIYLLILFWRLQRELERVNKTWEMKVTILQQTWVKVHLMSSPTSNAWMSEWNETGQIEMNSITVHFFRLTMCYIQQERFSS